jgi:RNA polymerase sigma-70 factor (ECF subfamily)
MFDARFFLQRFQRQEYTPSRRKMPTIVTTRSDCPHEHVHSDFADDLVLIRALQDGCEKCFDVLFARYWKLVFTIAWKILRERTDAEDIVQEVFLTMYLQRDRYESSRGSVKTWIAQFAHFKALMKRRYIQTRELVNLDEFSEFESGLMRFTASQGVLERAAFVEECLAGLNPRQRRTIELVHFDGYTLMETAVVLKQSLANTRNIYYRGMKALRSQLLSARSHAGKNETTAAGEIPEAAAESLAIGTDL